MNKNGVTDEQSVPKETITVRLRQLSQLNITNSEYSVYRKNFSFLRDLKRLCAVLFCEEQITHGWF